MDLVVYGIQRSRIILYDVDGTTPLSRITLQRSAPEGLTLKFTPEGIQHKLGSGSGWAHHWTHRGFRAQLAIKWNYGVQSQLEAWTGSGWGVSTKILTATALSLVFSHGLQAPCMVEPHLDKAYEFLAQPDPTKALELKDNKGVAHSGLELVLIATTLGALPDWAGL